MRSRLIAGAVVAVPKLCPVTLPPNAWCRRYLGKDGQKCTVQHYGHTPFVLLQSGKIITDWEAAKKSLTDAIGKCLQPLGFAADIHMGMFDDPTYIDTVRNEIELEKADDKDAEIARQKLERLDWLNSSIELLTSAVNLHELNILNVRFVREATRRKEPKFIARLTRAFEQRKTALANSKEDAA